jgi:hypothetical protein
VLNPIPRNPFAREAFFFLVFCFFTALVTWPYVTCLRDAVADPGDPYLVSWILWWDYHQTFTDPLNLFHSNLFYPFRYTLAFSEHCYGIALLFFPLFALGAQPLTVHAVAIFLGFAACGYGAFRLARTLTGSTGAGWIAGIIFAFVPFRFGLMSHLPYLFSAWIPILFEALVLFSRERSRGRATWLGIAFLMTGLTTITWLTLSLVPFAVCGAILLTRYRIWRDWAFWRRGAVAVGLASLALLPFLLPYSAAAKLYNFQRSVNEVKGESASVWHWLSADNRNRLWRGLGDHLPLGGRFRLFPGLLPILLSLAAWFLAVIRVTPVVQTAGGGETTPRRTPWIRVLDALAILAVIIAVPAIGTARNGTLYTIYTHVTSERVLAILVVAVIARFCLAYPVALRFRNPNFIETLRSERRSDAFWLGLALTIIGFCYSLGWNFFFYRILYDVLPFFRSMRVAVRGSMFAYLGLALLAGLGARCLAEILRQKIPRLRPGLVFAALGMLLLLELNASRLRFVRGEVDPDAVTLRLKETPMRGGLVVLPANGGVNHRHLLRAADHKKPMIVGTSGFNSPHEDRIEADTRSGPISATLMQLFEEIPASYVVIENELVPPERRVDYEAFLARAMVEGRLRFINRFDGGSDLYAVVKTEPETKSEAPAPFGLQVKDWATLLKEDPVNLLGQYLSWSQAVYRLHVAAYGSIPRYADFLRDAESVGIGVMTGPLDAQRAELEENISQLAEHPKFQERLKPMSNEGFVNAVAANARLSLSPTERLALIDKLKSGVITRAQLLLTIVNHPEFIESEQNRSLVLLHYFGYLHRNPDDPPDRNMDGLNFWIEEVEKSGEIDRLTRAFMASIEHREKTRR